MNYALLTNYSGKNTMVFKTAYAEQCVVSTAHCGLWVGNIIRNIF